MPKILIKETDLTSPGTPDSYSNFAVLIAGLEKTELTQAEAADGMAKIYTARRAKAADANGVYTFTSAEVFKDVIGLVAPKVTITYKPSGGANEISTTYYHYGNQMAYELLNMGYTVIYKPVERDAIADLCEESFWRDLKDKSNYDFRFVTHGLLESNELADKVAYTAAVDRLADVNKAIELLNGIIKKYQPSENAPADEEAKILQQRQDAYTRLLAGLKDGDSLEGVTVDPTNPPEGCAGFVKPTKAKTASFYTYTEVSDGCLSDEADTLKTAIKDSVAGGITTSMINDANACIANLAKYTVDDNDDAIPGRGDCVALIEVDEAKYTKSDFLSFKPEVRIIKAINEMTHIDSANGKFCAMTVPSVHYKMAIDKENPNEFGNNVKFPGAFHYLACFVNSLKLGFAEWYAAAGYTRGVASYMIDYTTVKLGEIAINALEPRNYSDPQENYPKFACNVIANFRGSYYLWGNRTAHPLGKKGSLDTGDLVASSFLNIRQLCCTIKKQLYVACRSFTFDPNSDTLWVNFCNAIKPTLEAMKADQGVRDYKVVKVYTDKKATLKAKIRIIPIEAVEDFDLEVSLEDSFGETAAVVTE